MSELSIEQMSRYQPRIFPIYPEAVAEVIGHAVVNPDRRERTIDYISEICEADGDLIAELPVIMSNLRVTDSLQAEFIEGFGLTYKIFRTQCEKVGAILPKVSEYLLKNYYESLNNLNQPSLDYGAKIFDGLEGVDPILYDGIMKYLIRIHEDISPVETATVMFGCVISYDLLNKAEIVSSGLSQN